MCVQRAFERKSGGGQAAEPALPRLGLLLALPWCPSRKRMPCITRACMRKNLPKPPLRAPPVLPLRRKMQKKKSKGSA